MCGAASPVRARCVQDGGRPPDAPPVTALQDARDLGATAAVVAVPAHVRTAPGEGGPRVPLRRSGADAPARGGRWVDRAVRSLPAGRRLPDEQWQRHHRFVLRTLAALTAVVAGHALVAGHGTWGAVGHAAPVAALAVLAALPLLGRGERANVAAAGLMTAAAVVVHLADGRTEAHFLFFALLPLAALYATPAPFVAAVGFVAVHHTVFGSLHHGSVFEHGQSVALMSALHAVFVLVESWACFVAWRQFEDRRAHVEHLVSERTARLQRQRDDMSRLALSDPLTGLANRSLLGQRLRALVSARRGGRGAVLLLDLDDFKSVNDVFGHRAGDAVLTAVARRLRSCVRSEDTVARLGGDEFVVLLDGARDAEEVAAVADRLVAAVRLPLAWGPEVFEVSCSVGVTLVDPADGREADELLGDADIAMYAAKASGRNRVEVFTPAMREAVVVQNQLARDLRAAVAGDQLFLLYQPQVDVRTRRVTGFEALVRWQHPERGLVPPDVFVPVAESTGTIDLVDDWVLAAACRQLAAWDAAGLPRLRVGVNVSARRLARGDLADAVRSSAGAAGVDPARLEVEITETATTDSAELAARVLHEVRALGVSIAIDDFGTGHSSFARLRALPVDRLKIDRSFVAALDPGAASRSIAGAMVAMGGSLGLHVVAEGVETEPQLEVLRALGCDTAQGYLFARPLPADEAERLLRAEAQPAS